MEKMICDHSWVFGTALIWIALCAGFIGFCMSSILSLVKEMNKEKKDVSRGWNREECHNRIRS
jgi:hypothetical protein